MSDCGVQIWFPYGSGPRLGGLAFRNPKSAIPNPEGGYECKSRCQRQTTIGRAPQAH